MIYEFCPKCGKKELTSSDCGSKWRCSNCGYFVLDEDFQDLKEMRKNGN